MIIMSRSAASVPVRRLALACAVAVSLVAAGCGSDNKDKPATQVAAKVNKGEISVHQINYVLQQQRGLRAEQAEQASRTALERLIDQELAVQKAGEMKLDREPSVVQALEAARREILARAYLEKVAEGASQPTAEEVTAYYREKPALFSNRRVYNLQEIAISAEKEQVGALEEQLKNAQSTSDFLDYLRSNNIRFAVNQASRAAEQLPLSMLEAFHGMKDGQALLVPSDTGAQAIVLVASREAPVDEARARPAIEQYLTNERKRRVVEQELKALRDGAEIEYVGKYAEAAASPATTTAAPAQAPASAPGAAEAGGSDESAAINKGLSGLK